MSNKFNYKKYLASREWALLKEQVRKRSRGRCERCCVGDYESTHHVTYERIGREDLADLLAVCNKCHEFLSAKSSFDPSTGVILMVIAVSGDWIGAHSRQFGEGMAHANAEMVGRVLPQHVDMWTESVEAMRPAWFPKK